MRVGIQRLDEAATLPTRAHHADAGLDLYALTGSTLAPGERGLVRTGIAIELPRGHAALVLPRSGNAARHGISLVNAPGLIDEGYRGEIKVLLLNTDRADAFTVEPGARIAQLVIIKVSVPDLVELDVLEDSSRGAGGFGSSGA
jgi:dUTP pyrophosphatase